MYYYINQDGCITPIEPKDLNLNEDYHHEVLDEEGYVIHTAVLYPTLRELFEVLGG